MANGFGDFNKRMKAHGANVVKNANIIKRKAALAVDATVVLATPVDTGRARSNWQVSLNVPITDDRDAFAPGKAGSTGGTNAQAALNQGKGVIDSAQPGSGIYITNNLPYIGRLNDGSSAQAPAGFVQDAVLQGINAVKKEGATILRESSRDGD